MFNYQLNSSEVFTVEWLIHIIDIQYFELDALTSKEITNDVEK